MHYLKKIVARLLLILFSLFPIDNNKVVFSSFDGNSFNDNPKAIYDYLNDHYPNHRYIWFFYDTSLGDVQMEKVKAYSIKALFHQATARVWVFNSRQREWMRKRKGQTYIQTWHGGLALKQIEKDIEDVLPAYYVREAKNDSQMADYFVSASRWNSLNYRNAFWYDGTILECGLPRTDLYYRDHSSIKTETREALGLSTTQKIVVYAPTFRDDGDTSFLLSDYRALLDSLKKYWGGDWCCVVKLHPNTHSKLSFDFYNKYVLDGNRFDLSSLLIVADLLITDYSSCMFDAIELNLNTILFIPDIMKYSEGRGTYFQLEELPFEKCCSEEELEFAIASFDRNRFISLSNSFIDKVGLYNNGTAAKTLSKIIVDCLK